VKLEKIPDDIWTRRTGSAEHTILVNTAIDKINELTVKVEDLNKVVTDLVDKVLYGTR
jgi:hypothetical protein